MVLKKTDCFKCKHFFVTWDPRFPRGCKAFNFKGVDMPSNVVLSASAAECKRFAPKTTEEKEPGDKDRFA